MILILLMIIAYEIRMPRASGDDPYPVIEYLSPSEYAPRKRG